MGNTITRDDLVLAANTIRCLSADAVQKAKSGHPGMPMGMADVATVLFLNHLNHNPENPKWPDRDRLVLSGGHGSMLLYSMLHLSGYDLPLSELQAFRQWGSKTPGHPEYGHTPGVETTTGPLGQGCGNAVGMALAERMLAERFNTPEIGIVDHTTYVFCGDGDLMEGVSHEAFSLAGHLGLNKLIVFYDDNKISIEGATSLAYSDDVRKRFQGYHFNVIQIDAHDFDQIDKAIRKGRRSKDKPTLIICCSHIAHGSPGKHDTAGAHGEPLGPDEVKATKKNLGFAEDQDFVVPERIRELYRQRLGKLKSAARKWEKAFSRYAKINPDKAAQWKRQQEDLLPENLEAALPAFDPAKPIATRQASSNIIQSLAAAIPWLVGGSADLAPSTKTLIEKSESVAAGKYAGRNLRFGVREHGMCALLNGMTLHGGFRVYGATFFVFSDYCRPSIRLACLMKLPVIYVFTHDSFCVGEDGPTHEPIEHLAALRCMPGMTLIRPADATETGAAWIAALKNKTGPTALMLTRQNLPVLDRTQLPPAADLEKGAYVLSQTGTGDPAVILIASGSEVALAVKAAAALAGRVNVRVVSMPSWEIFERQAEAYKREVLPPACPQRLAIEAGASLGWERYVGEKGRTLCIDHYGASAPYPVLEEKFGFTVQNVTAIVKQMAGGH